MKNSERHIVSEGWVRREPTPEEGQERGDGFVLEKPRAAGHETRSVAQAFSATGIYEGFVLADGRVFVKF